MTDDIGADGVSVKEALASRAFGSIDAIMAAHVKDGLPIEWVHVAIKAVFDAVSPFVDRASFEILNQIMTKYDEELAAHNEAKGAAGDAIMEGWS